MARKKANLLPEGDAEEHARRLAKSIPGIGSIGLKVKCRNKTQKELLRTIREKEVTIVSGPAGTGKSFITLFTALELLKEFPEDYKKLLLIYPTEEDDGESLGFLPGTVEEKMNVWARPDLYTIEKIINLSTGKDDGAKRVIDMVQAGLIEIHPTTFLRGLTIDNSIICVNETQNLSSDSLLKVLTRVGDKTKMIISGDLGQLSAKGIKRGKRESGLRYALTALNILEEIGTVEFTAEDIIRNPLISKILMAWSPEEYGYLKDAPGIKAEDI